MKERQRNFSFAAIVGHDKLKTAYLANIVNPHIGGLLISGAKGTGKSTVVHSVERTLPQYDAVKGCIFSCDPDQPGNLCSLCRERAQIERTTEDMRIVNLPLSCSEDRLIGSVDIEKLLKEGKKEVQQGILGEANRNILYVDEVNLLPDHLVDDILDAAASHWSTIEREGISISHPAEFVLVGTMNPEEGELRPQILDRFPLCAKVKSVADPEQRVEIIKRNLLFERNPEEFYRIFRTEEEDLRKVIADARSLLGETEVDERFLYAIAAACAELKVDGQRPDIIMVKTAQTIAALGRRALVKGEDILVAAELTLNHRTRDGGALDPPSPEVISAIFGKYLKKIAPASVSAAKKEKLPSTPRDIKEKDDVLDGDSQSHASEMKEAEGEMVKKKVVTDAKTEFKSTLGLFIKRSLELLKSLPKAESQELRETTNIPVRDGAGPYLFSSRQSLYDSTKKVFHKFLRRYRKAKSRATRGSRRRSTVITTTTGRNIRTVAYEAGENSLAPLRTVLNFLHTGRYDLKGKRINILKKNLVGWQRLEHESLTLISVVDVSESTFSYINVFAEILRSLTRYFNRNNDRIGLISLQGVQAEILNHPTHNYRIITKALTRLEIHGETPLADGLLKALYMAKLERFRKPGSKNLVILLSDCYPEPLVHKYENIFDEPAYKNAVNAASLYRRNKIFLLVINPSFRKNEKETLLPGEKLSEIIAGVSRGKLIKLYRPVGLYSAAEKLPQPGRREIETILKGIEDTFSEIKFGV